MSKKLNKYVEKICHLIHSWIKIPQIHLWLCHSRVIRFLTCLDKCVIFLQPIIIIYELLKQVMDSCNLLSLDASWAKFNLVALREETRAVNYRERILKKSPYLPLLFHGSAGLDLFCTPQNCRLIHLYFGDPAKV